MSDAVDGPLLRDGVAHEDEDEVEDKGPEDHDSGDNVHGCAQSVGENAVVEGELGELEGREAPDVD